MIAYNNWSNSTAPDGWTDNSNSTGTTTDYHGYICYASADNYSDILFCDFGLPLNSWAADYFFPPEIPVKLKYNLKPKLFKHKILKQPVARAGFKRGQRI